MNERTNLTNKTRNRPIVVRERTRAPYTRHTKCVPVKDACTGHAQRTQRVVVLIVFVFWAVCRSTRKMRARVRVHRIP